MIQELLNAFNAEFKRMLLICYRNKANFINSFIFFIIAIFIIHLSIGPKDLPISGTFGLITTYLIFTILLTTNMLFDEDHRNGIIDEQKILSTPLEILILAKYFSYNLILISSSLFILPLVILILNIPVDFITVLMMTIFLIILNQTLFGLLFASLTIGINSSTLLSLLILPLSTPMIIAANLATSNPSILLLLLGMFLFFLPVSIKLTKLAINNII
jgi:heme exporter protein B